MPAARAVVAIAALLLPLAAPAEEAPERAAREMQQLRSTIGATAARQKEMENQAASLKRETEALQQEMARQAKDVQAKEGELGAVEAQLHALQEQEKAKAKIIRKTEAQVHAAMGSMVRLSAIPPETALLVPQKTEDALVAAQVLHTLSERFRQQSETLRQEVEAIRALRETIAKRFEEEESAKAALAEKQRELETRIAERKAMFLAASANSSKLTREMEALSERSRSLQDLLERVEAARQAREAETKAKQEAARREKEKTRDFAAAKGRLRLPASGKIVTTFGAQEEGQGSASKGITIATREQAQVVSPFDGEVMFTGPFLRYGNLVIVKHDEDSHTLIAGMARIQCQTGQRVIEGEPLGVMGEEKSGQTKLYLELRRSGKPVDPTPWFAAISSKSSG